MNASSTFPAWMMKLPGQGVLVYLVRVDETHVFKHAEDALQTKKRKIHLHTYNTPPHDLLTSPHHRRAFVRQRPRRVRELCKAGVDLLHRLDPFHHQLNHLFLRHLQGTQTESYGANDIDSVSGGDSPGAERGARMGFLPSCGTSSFRWPGGT